MIVELKLAPQLGQRAALLRDRPGDDGPRLGLDDAADHGHTRLDNAGLLAGNRRQGAAQLPGMVVADARDHGHGRRADVGRIEPASQPHFEHRHVDRAGNEVQQGQSGEDLEIGRAMHRDRRRGPWPRRPDAPVRPGRPGLQGGRAGRRPKSALRAAPDGASCTGRSAGRRPSESPRLWRRSNLCPSCRPRARSAAVPADCPTARPARACGRARSPPARKECSACARSRCAQARSRGPLRIGEIRDPRAGQSALRVEIARRAGEKRPVPPRRRQLPSL